MPYFIITCSEDGLNIEQTDEAGVKKFIKEYEDDDVMPEYRPTFLDKLPKMQDGYFYFGPKGPYPQTPVLLVKGEIVVPKPVQVVTEYEL